MKFLRYALTFILCLLTITTCCLFSASAENIEYELKDLKMTIAIPDSMAVKTKENSDTLADTIYLEATNPDSSLTISVSMIKNKKTQEIYSFQNMPYSTLEEYKDQMLQNDGYIECKDGTYGDIPFLDFSQKYTTDAGVEIYGKQSVTLVNGMSISITSQSAGDSFTSDELVLIKSCLDSIEIDYSKNTDKGIGFWGVFLWVVIILLVLLIAFLVFSYYMGKKNAARKQAVLKEKRKKADYDVLTRAENSAVPDKTSGKVGGYKSSSDYFDEDFDKADSKEITPAKKSTESAQTQGQTPAHKAVRSTKKAFTHMGYFFSNMKREINKSKKAKAHTKTTKAPKKRTKTRDYDVFSDK